MKEGSHVKTRPDRPWTEDAHATAGNKGSDRRTADLRARAETSERESANAEPWPIPKDIETALRRVPPMSREMLPDVMAVWLCDIAHRMQCPLDFVGSAEWS